MLDEKTKKDKMRLKNRLYYLKRIGGDIRYFSKNYEDDAKLLQFLKNKKELEELFNKKEQEKEKINKESSDSESD
jgi:hypothetical protein